MRKFDIDGGFGVKTTWYVVELFTINSNVLTLNVNVRKLLVVNDFPVCATPFKFQSIVEFLNGDTTLIPVAVEFKCPVYDLMDASKVPISTLSNCLTQEI